MPAIPSGIQPSADEIAYLCDVANQHFRATIGPADVVWSFAGVRALHDDGSRKAQDVTRDYLLALDERDGEAPLLTVYGGKITTYRRLAEQALDRLAHIVAGGPAWTRESHLPGGEFPYNGFETLVTADPQVAPVSERASTRGGWWPPTARGSSVSSDPRDGWRIWDRASAPT